MEETRVREYDKSPSSAHLCKLLPFPWAGPEGGQSVVLEYFEKDIVGQYLGSRVWFCTTPVSMLRKDCGARNLFTSPLLMARYQRTPGIATFIAYYAAKYSLHCHGKVMWEVILA